MHQRRLIAEMMEMMEVIAFNAGYTRYFEDESILMQHEPYFDICQLIFSELNIKIIKIQQYKQLRPGQKMQQLIDLLATELKVDLSEIRGEEIVNYNLAHIHKFLDLLYEYSKIYMESKKPKYGVRSQSSKGGRQYQAPAIISARDPYRNYQTHDNEESSDQYEGSNEDNQSSGNQEITGEDREEPDSHKHVAIQKKREQEQRQPRKRIIRPDNDEPQLKPQKTTNINGYLIEQLQDKPKKKKKVKAMYSAQKKRARSQKQQRANLHSNVVNTIMIQKTKILKAGDRDNRKDKMTDLKLAKNEYKVYLQRYAKENKTKNLRQSQLKSKSKKAVKTVRQQLPIQDFNKIDNFFESFAYRFRDKKAAYLRKIQQLVRKQEQDRFCHHNRIERQTKVFMEDRLKHQMEAQRHQHRVKSVLQKQEAKALEQEVAIIMKEDKRRVSQQKKQLKEAKKLELQKIENFLRQDNQKVLMNLQEGGQLEQIIMKMYKRF